jgi:hypothetical protein
LNQPYNLIDIYTQNIPIIDCNQNFVYSNNINTMNALLLPDLIQSMISWYLWKNKISLLNKQYHEVFQCTKIDEDDDPHELFIFHRTDEKWYQYVKFNWRYFWTLPEDYYYYDGGSKLFNERGWDELLFINSWKFNKMTNTYKRMGKYYSDKKITSNYFYTNDDCHDLSIHY